MSATLAQSTAPGTRCVSVVLVPSASCKFPITVCRVYEAVARRDGIVTWRPVQGTDKHRTSHSGRDGVSMAQFRRAEAYAAELGITVKFGVKLGRVCE